METGPAGSDAMSHDRCFRLIPESAFAPGLPDRSVRLMRLLRTQHHTVPERLAEHLHLRCRGAVPNLFAGVRVGRAELAVDHLFLGAETMRGGRAIFDTGSWPRLVHGPPLAWAQEVLRALRPSRLPALTSAEAHHLSALRTHLRHVDADRMRWVTWVAP